MISRKVLRYINRRTTYLTDRYVGYRVWIDTGPGDTWTLQVQGRTPGKTTAALSPMAYGALNNNYSVTSVHIVGIVYGIKVDIAKKMSHELEVLPDDVYGFLVDSKGKTLKDQCRTFEVRLVRKKRKLTIEEMLTHNDERVRKVALCSM